MKHLLFLQVILIQSISGHSQWSNDPTVNNPICTTIAYQSNPAITSDDFQGAIIVWDDYLMGDYKIYAQRINYAGSVQWPINGVQICDSTFDNGYPQIVADEFGGAIMVWEDQRSGTNKNIYAQRINSSGTIMWTTNGIPVCTAPGEQTKPRIVSDGSGGAIIVWLDTRNGNSDIYAQQMDLNGLPQWGVNGIAICTASGNQTDVSLAFENASSAATITWVDPRNGNQDIYAQKVNTLGVTQWLADGNPICLAIGNQYSPKVVSGDFSSSIITWQDDRGASQDIYAQKINLSGTIQWIIDGIAVCSQADIQVNPNIVFDGMDAFVITWEDRRNGASDIYAQRIYTNGAFLWASDGIAVCNANNIQLYPQVIKGMFGKSIIAWQDYRNGNFDVYAQQLSATGIPQWGTDGIQVSIASGDQYYPKMVSYDNNGAILTWKDVRGDGDIYAQAITASGILSVETENNLSTINQIFPNPFKDEITLVSSLEGQQIIYIINTMGEVVLSKEIILISELPANIELNGLSRGVYYLKIGTTTKKIVKM